MPVTCSVGMSRVVQRLGFAERGGPSFHGKHVDIPRQIWVHPDRVDLPCFDLGAHMAPRKMKERSGCFWLPILKGETGVKKGL